ncbi:MAG: protein-L-isoaspartate O-methyltransferase [Pseudomonadota bacterium]
MVRSSAAALAVASGLVIGVSGCYARQEAAATDFAEHRAEMLAVIARHARAASELTGIRRIDPHIMAAMGTVPRHEFVPDNLRDLAYLDTPLPLGREQNVAQPYLVALMTHLARIETGDVVFETGTGAGYHAAVLSLLAARVVSVEVVSPLALRASAKLKALNFGNVEVIASDGYYGAPGKGPFDAMIVKEAIDHVPPPLLAQLKPGGRLVLPLGPLEGPQFLTVVEKLPDGRTRDTRILPVTFTPLQGGERI